MILRTQIIYKALLAQSGILLLVYIAISQSLPTSPPLLSPFSALYLAISALALTCTYLLMCAMNRSMTERLSLLKHGANALADGDLDHRVPLQPTDELGNVAESFNGMAKKLQELMVNLDNEIGINQAMFVTSPSSIVIIDSKGTITNFNPAAEKTFGYTADEAIDQNVKMLLPKEYAAIHDTYIQRYLESDEAHVLGKGREVKGIKKDGSEIPLFLSLGKMLVHGETMFVGMINDITSRKRSEEKLRAYQDNLEEIVKQRTKALEDARDAAEAGARTKASFVANMSHEIRTPMNAIIGFTEVLLMDKSLNSDSRHQAETILTSARLLLTIINDILDISKLESGKFALETVCFHLPNAVNQALRTLEAKAAEKDLTLSLEIESSLPQKFLGDPTRLRQVLLNLVGNAIKFTERGGVTVRIYPSSEENMLHFEIEDTGIGMSQVQIDTIFDSFVQADISTTRKFGGTGLGTTICKQIVDLMEGKIWVDSRLGKGSTFHFTCVISPEDPNSTQDCLYEADYDFTNEFQSPRLFKILLAEDIKANAQLAMLRLNHQGHVVNWVENGREAVQAFQEDKYDLILMDVMMPEMDGLEATQIIRKLETQMAGRPHIPIVALTASVMREDYNRCRASGMDRMVGKPIQIEKLLTTMEEVVPENAGELKSMHQYEIPETGIVDFSPISGCIDVKEALAVWQDEAIYAKALMSFVKEHGNDAKTIRMLIDMHPSDTTPAKAYAHALKGLAGNLHIDGIANLAIEIDEHLKQNSPKAAIKLIEPLKKSITTVVNAVNKLDLSMISETSEPSDYDEEEVLHLLKQLFDSLNQFNPDAAEPFLNELTKYIGKGKTKAIRRKVDSFDFDAALDCVKTLAQELNLALGGVE